MRHLLHVTRKARLFHVSWQQVCFIVFFLGLGLSTSLPTRTFAQSLTDVQLERQTTDLINQGNYSKAQALINAEQPPEHIQQLFRARLAKAQGQYQTARSLLEAAHAAAPYDLPIQRELAHSLFHLGDTRAAERHLKALLSRDDDIAMRAGYRAMLQRIHVQRPLHFALQVAATPSSNINNGTYEDVFDTILGNFTVDPQSRQTSGTGYRATGQVRWATTLQSGRSLSVTGRTIYLRYPQYSPLDKTAQELTFAQRSAISKGWLEPRLTLRRLKANDGSDYRAFGAGFGLWRKAGDLGEVGLNFGIERRRYGEQTYRNGSAYHAAIDWQRPISRTSIIGLGLSGNRLTHKAKHLAYDDVAVTATLTHALRAGLNAEVTAILGKRRYKSPAPLTRDPRREDYAGLTAKLQFGALHFALGIPEFACSLSRNRSNIALYSYNTRSCSLSLTKQF